MGFSVVKINRFPSIAVPGRRPFRLLFGDLPAMHGFDIDDGLSFRRTQSPNTPIAGSFIGEIPVTYQFNGTIITIHVLAMLLNHSHSRKGFFVFLVHFSSSICSIIRFKYSRAFLRSSTPFFFGYRYKYLKTLPSQKARNESG